MHSIAVHSEEVFQALADETRLRIVRLMVVEAHERACLCELVDSLLEPSYKLSRHLAILRRAGLLASHKEGRWVYHRLVTKPAYLKQLYATVKALPDPRKIYRADLKRFHDRMRLREDGRCQVGIQSDAFRSETG